MTTLLSPPYNLLSLSDGDDVIFQPASYELGAGANPHGFTAPGALVPVLRVWYRAPGPDAPRSYLDFTSRRLIAILPPLLDEFAGTGARVRVLAAGAPPRTEYTVSVEPA